MRQAIENEISLQKLWLFLLEFRTFALRRKGLAITILVLGILSGIAFSFISKPVYKGVLTFVLENSGKSRLGGYGGLAAQFGLNLFDGGGMFQDEDNIIALIQSRSMISRTLLTKVDDGSELLIDRYLRAQGYQDEWKNDNTLSSLSFIGERSRLQDSVLGFVYHDILKKHLVVAKPDKKLDIVSIETQHVDELFAKQFTEKLLDNVTRFYVEVQTKKSQENVGILRHQVDSVRHLLNDAISGVAISAEANPNINPALQRLRIPAQRRVVDVEMNKAILTELVKNLELAEITLRKETPLVQVIDRPILPLLKKELTLLKGIFLGGLLGGFAAVALLFLQLLHSKSAIGDPDKHN